MLETSLKIKNEAITIIILCIFVYGIKTDIFSSLKASWSNFEEITSRTAKTITNDTNIIFTLQKFIHLNKKYITIQKPIKYHTRVLSSVFNQYGSDFFHNIFEKLPMIVDIIAEIIIDLIFITNLHHYIIYLF